MRISVAQIKPDKANIEYNIEAHIKSIDIAISLGVDLIVFPELSITSYEPEYAEQLASTENDPRLEVFQKTSDHHNIIIGVGLPIKSDSGIYIGSVFFHPNTTKQVYAKQMLHSDEIPYFIPGHKQTLITVKDTVIAPAICYESLQPEHAEKANKLGADIYIASVAKSQNGINKAMSYFPETAMTYSMPVLMSNSIGHCDNFMSAGQTSIWNEKGILIGQLDDKNEGLLIFDTQTKEVIEQNIS